MVDELNFSPLGYIIFITINIILLILILIQEEKPFIDLESLEAEKIREMERKKAQEIKKKNQVIASRRGAYIQIQHR